MRRRETIAYSASPLLASRTPVWRSRFILAALALAFLTLAGRAVYVQVLDNDFFQRQGEARFARTIKLPPSRGRVLDRNGLILASSVPAYGICDAVCALNTCVPLVTSLRFKMVVGIMSPSRANTL